MSSSSLSEHVIISTVQNDVSCIQPAPGHNGNCTDLSNWCRANRKLLRKIVFRKGGLLLRGWDVKCVSIVEEIIHDAIGFQTMESYPQWFLDFNKRAERLGVPAAGLVQTKRSRNVPHATPNQIQCPHVEFGAGPYRPRVVGFYCEIVPQADGESGRVYFPDAIERLSPEIRELLEQKGWWNPLANNIVQPSILVHPETKKNTMQLYSFSHTLAPCVFKAYQKVRSTKEKAHLPLVEGVFYAGSDTYGITLVNDDGSLLDLTEEQMVEIYRAILSTLELHTWQKDDILLFDNMLYGHMRMPGGEPRKLHALFAEEVDSRTMIPHEKVATCVTKDAKKACPSAINTTLQQLGPGGSKWILATLTYLPDFLFRLIGKYFWLSGKGYNV
mmetsp:Transcript_24714/g.30371  ORF Transcript_24714/g.30371 Transcript_24714/m.30371 type:complete len:386 (+) Transcript_24714:110-1267(+)